MKAYELLFFVDPSLDPETRLAVMKRIDTTIAEGAGKVDSVDEWGKRKLAYEINDLTDGDYTLINFHADPTQIAELDRVLRITDAVAVSYTHLRAHETGRNLVCRLLLEKKKKKTKKTKKTIKTCRMQKRDK